MRTKEFGFKNFCGYGNKLQSIKLSDEPELVLITGDNGGGKTTIGDALLFGLYGKTKRSISSLPNRLNKNAYSYVYFDTEYGDSIELHRGIAPNFSNMKRNGIEETVAGKEWLDSLVEKDLVDVPFDVCSNTLIMSMDDFKSFLTMKKQDKRRIIDKIFSIDDADLMYAILKDDIKETDSKRDKATASLEEQKSMRVDYQKKVKELEEATDKEAGERKKEIESSIASKEVELDIIEKDIKAKEEELEKNELEQSTELKEITDKYSKERSKYVSKIEEAEKTINKDRDAALNKVDDRSGKLTQLAADVQLSRNKAVDDKADWMDKQADSRNQKEHDEYNAGYLIKLGELKKEKEDYKLAVDQLKEDIEQKQKTQSENIFSMQSEKMMLEKDIETLAAKIALYKKGVCPECDTDLKTKDHKHKSDDIKKRHEEKISELESLKANIEKREIDNKDVIGDLEGVLSERQESLDSVIDRIEKLNEAKQVNIDALSKKILKLKTQISEWQKAQYAVVSSDWKVNLGRIDKAVKSKRDEHIREYDEKLKTKTKSYRDKITESESKEKKEKDRLSSKWDPVIKEINDEISAKNKSKDSIDSDIILLRADIDALEDAIKNNQAVKSMNEMLKKCEKRIGELDDELFEIETEAERQTRVKDLFIDDGLKRIVLEQALPVLNSSIEKLIEKVGFKFYFKFDNEFDPIITHLGMDAPVDSLSSGQRRMANVIIILAMLELVLMNHPSMNVMFLDEIFANLSARNIAKVCNVLREYMERYKINVFVMSHTQVPLELFDKTIEAVEGEYFCDMTIK